MTIGENSSGDIEAQSKDETLEYIRSVIKAWDFENHSDQELNSEFTTHIAHWLLETFGQENNQGEFFLSTPYDGFGGEELPDDLKHLVLDEYRGELYLPGGNKIRLQTQHVYEEEKPFLPEWEQIREKFVAYQAMLDYVLSRPDIIARIEEGKVKVLPQVAIDFSPHFAFGWGLHFLVSRHGVLATPYGESGKTRNATEFVLNNQDNPKKLLKIVCELAVLASKYSSVSQPTFPGGSLDSLGNRIRGEESIPLCLGKFVPNPGNAVLSLLIKEIKQRRS